MSKRTLIRRLSLVVILIAIIFSAWEIATNPEINIVASIPYNIAYLLIFFPLIYFGFSNKQNKKIRIWAKISAFLVILLAFVSIGLSLGYGLLQLITSISFYTLSIILLIYFGWFE